MSSFNFPPALFEAAVKAVRGKATSVGSECSPSLQSILQAFEKDGNGDRVMLLALLQAKKAEDERLAALSYALAVQYLSLAASAAPIPSANSSIAKDPSPVPSVTSSRTSDRSSFSDNESIATTVSLQSRKRKSPSPADTESHTSVMSALREKILAKTPAQTNDKPIVKRRKPSPPQSVNTATTSYPSLTSSSAPSPRLYRLPLSTTPIQGPSESEKFRASLNLLNIAAERELRSPWQTSDVRGQAV